ncbi:hypothetical protein BST41_30095 [Mycolicibacterium porcinum]|nr:hypothetical protein BST41_30095 [Mycolicibacterium porcinum]
MSGPCLRNLRGKPAGAAALVKLRLISLHFLDLRSAPLPLRAVFEFDLVVVFALLAALIML